MPPRLVGGWNENANGALSAALGVVLSSESNEQDSHRPGMRVFGS